jgi:predicted AAA+ superfamily ATPase
MGSVLAFGDVLEAVDELPLEEQETLIEVVRRRIIERRREELAREIQDAQKEFQTGHCRPVTPGELMAEILS